MTKTMLNQSIDVSKLRSKESISKMNGTAIVLVDPSLAEYWLSKFNVANRTLSEVYAKEYSRRMQEGHWKLNGETIKFDTNGNLIDGQHRCRAIILYGDCVQMELRFGVDPNAFETLDEGKKRSPADVVSRIGIPNYTNVAAAATFIIRHERGRHTRAGSGTGKISNREVLDWYYDNPEISDMVLFGQKLYEASARILPVSKFTAYLYLLGKSDENKAESFLTKLALGSNIGTSSPIWKLRSKLMQSKVDRQKRLNEKVVQALIIKAWNLFKAGKTVKILKFDTVNESFPEIE